jgi:hypothetical protein
LRHFLWGIFSLEFGFIDVNSELGLYLGRIKESLDNRLIAAEIIIHA